MRPTYFALHPQICLPKLTTISAPMNWKRLIALFGLAAFCVAGSGCAGYQLGSLKPTAMSHIESIAIPTFSNKTLEPRSQVLVTNEVIKQLQRDGTYSVADPAKGGDAILHGTITDIERRQMRSSRTDVLRTREMEFRLIVEFTLEDTETGAELDRGTIMGVTSVYLDPNFQLTERQALQIAAEDLAQRLASRISEGY